MIKRTLYFGNRSVLTLSSNNLVISQPSEDDPNKLVRRATIPTEDIGVVILDNQEITISLATIQTLLENNTALISCDAEHLPNGLMLNLYDHQQEQRHLIKQLSASEALRKRVWKQTVESKIENQIRYLNSELTTNQNELITWIVKLKSENYKDCNIGADIHYYSKLEDIITGLNPNNNNCAPSKLLNFGYALLRALAARALVAAGLHPMYGIESENRFTHYALADDIMQPYIPFIDRIAVKIVRNNPNFTVLNSDIKRELLSIPLEEVEINGVKTPLIVAMRQTATSLTQCLEGKEKKITYPSL
ncbi:MAG: type II CRISPR-associated endonuclease Cas1 [Bacteroidales bacterium]